MNSRQYKGIVLILGVLLGASFLFNGIQATTPSTGPYYLSVPTGTWIYQVAKFSNGSYYMVASDDWHVDYISTNATTVVNYALGNMTTGGTLLLSPDVAVAGIVTISYKNTAIVASEFKGMESGADWYYTPYITTINIDSSGTELRNIYISGLCTKQLKFNANGNAISNVKVQNVAFRPSGAANEKGIIFTGASLINYVEFVDCWIYDLYDQSVDALGAISFQQTTLPGSGQYYFTRLHYKAGTDSTTMCAWGSAARIDQVCVFDQLDHVVNGHNGHKIFYFKQGSKQYWLKVTNSGFEEHQSVTMFTIDAGHAGATQKRWITFAGNTATCGDDPAYTLTLITNNAVEADYYSTAQSYMIGWGNTIIAESTLGVFALGTNGTCTHFIFDVGYTYWRGTTEITVPFTRA